jgi:hypothetical protein
MPLQCTCKVKGVATSCNEATLGFPALAIQTAKAPTHMIQSKVFSSACYKAL